MDKKAEPTVDSDMQRYTHDIINQYKVYKNRQAAMRRQRAEASLAQSDPHHGE
jgi:hypothetical protein